MTDGTLTKQTFDGTNFGTPSTVNLNGLTEFAGEMQQMTGMFYLNGRIYYTLAGSGQLFGRGFAADLDVVDARELHRQRATSPISTGPRSRACSTRTATSTGSTARRGT